MKFITLAIGLLFFLPSQAQQNFGIGAVIGDPTGVSAKWDLDEVYAIDAAMAWSGGSRTGVHLHSNYLRDHGQISSVTDEMPLHLYYGIGARLVSISKGDKKGKIAIGPRAPIGITTKMTDPSVEFFAEAALVLDLTPSTSADADVGLGARYWF